MAMSRRSKKRAAILVVAIAGLALGVGGLFVARTVRQQNRAQAALVDGLQAYENRDYLGATDNLGRYISRNRDDGEMILKFVESRRRVPMPNARHLQIATDWARNAASAMPDDPRPLEALLTLYSERGLVTEYMETADRLLRIDPRNKDAMLARVTGFTVRGELDASFEAARAFAEAHPDDWRGHAAMVDVMRRRGDTPQVVRRYIDAIAERKPDDINVALQQARAALFARQREAATTIMTRASTLRVPDSETLARVIVMLDALELRSLADRMLEREADNLGDDARVVAIDRAWKDGRAREAADLARRAIGGRDLGAAGDSLVGWGALALTATRTPEDDALAARCLEELSRRKTDSSVHWVAVLAASNALDANDIPAARERLEEARSLMRGSGLPDFMLGQVEMRIGDRRGAIARWRSVVERDPRWLAARLALTSALLDDGELREAQASALDALRLAPDRVVVARMFARATAALADAESPDRDLLRLAIDAMQQLLDQGAPDPGVTLSLLARLKAAEGDLEGAQALVDRITREKLELPPGDALALASAVQRRGLRGAEALLQSSPQVAEDPGVLYARAIQAAADNRVDEGKALLRGALARRSGPEALPYDRALAQYLDAVRDPDAFAALKRLSDANQDNPDVQRDLLRSNSAWRDEIAVKNAIDRLRGALGEASPSWRVFEARRLLTFRPAVTSAASGGDPTQANAALVVQLLASVVRNDPGDAHAAALLTEAHLLLGSRDAAIGVLSTAVTASPGEPTLYPRLITLLQERGDAAAAAQRLNDFLQIRDLSPELRRTRADLLLAQGMWAQALPELEQIALSGEPADTLRLARAYLRQGRAADAERVYAMLEGLNPPTTISVVGVAEYYIAKGELGRAVAMLDRIPESEPAASRALIRADILERAGQPERAERELRDVAEAENTGDVWLALARHYVRRGMMDEGKTAADRGLAVAPNDQTLRSLAGGLAMARGDEPSGTIRPDQRGDVSGGQNAEMRTLAAIQALRTNPDNIEGYITILRGVIADFPRYFPARRLLTIAHVERLEFDRATEQAREAMRVLPVDAAPAQLLTEVLATRSQFDLSRGLPDSSTRFAEQALAAARDWRSRSLADPFDADFAIAQLLETLNNPREALRVLAPYEERLKLVGLDAAPLQARLFAKTGQTDRAEAALMPRATTDEQWATAHADTARVLSADPRVVRDWLSRSESFVGTSVQGRLTVVQAWYDLSQRTKDDADLRQAVRVLRGMTPEERRGPGGLMLATIYELLGDKTEAEAAYREALRMLPDQPITMNNLSYLLTQQGVKLDEAVSLAQRAVELAEQQGFLPTQRVNFLDSLGAALERAGRSADAEAAYRKGLALEPTNRMLMVGLAESLVSQSKTAEAERVLKQAEDSGPVRRDTDPLRARIVAARERLASSAR